jgi:hypothetical protein
MPQRYTPSHPIAQITHLNIFGLRFALQVAEELRDAQVAASQFGDAETTLLEAHQIMTTVGNAPQWDPVHAFDELVQLYGAWHAVEPDKGHDLKAAEWRVKLSTFQIAIQSTAEK